MFLRCLVLLQVYNKELFSVQVKIDFQEWKNIL